MKRTSFLKKKKRSLSHHNTVISVYEQSEPLLPSHLLLSQDSNRTPKTCECFMYAWALMGLTDTAVYFWITFQTKATHTPSSTATAFLFRKTALLGTSTHKGTLTRPRFRPASSHERKPFMSSSLYTAAAAFASNSRVISNIISIYLYFVSESQLCTGVLMAPRLEDLVSNHYRR